MTLSAKHYLWLGNIVLLGLVVWSGAGLGLRVVEERLETRIKAQRPVKARTVEDSRLGSLNRYEAIVSNNIFGGRKDASASEEVAASAAPAAPAPGAVADLRLRGTIVGHRPPDSAAIIEDKKSQEQSLYRPGDLIGRIEVARITSDHVILRDGGREVRLDLFLDDAGPLPRNDDNRPADRPADRPKQEGATTGTAARKAPSPRPWGRTNTWSAGRRSAITWTTSTSSWPTCAFSLISRTENRTASKWPRCGPAARSISSDCGGGT